MYHVIGTGLTTFLFYLLSYFFYHNGFYTVQTHRKLWNTILAISFILTALAGLLMALQTTYKWDVPYIKQILKWHVEFGIGMAITGLFHFFWHLPYFTGLFSKSEIKTLKIDSYNISSGKISVNLFVVGFISTSIQLLLIRELMNIAGGYELITGTFLASWLIGSAAGAAIAGRSIFHDIRRINLIFSLSPVASLFLMFLLSRLYMNPGQTPSLLETIIFTFLVLLPFTFVSGFTFIKLITIANSENRFVAGKSFSIETAGGIASGVVISILTAGILNTYQIILLIIVFANGYVLLTYFLIKKFAKTSVQVIIILTAAAIIIFHPDNFFRELLLPELKISYSEDTPYGNISKGEYKGESSTYYNQRLLSYKNDAIEREENIHYAMVQSQNPDKVIIISGSQRSNLPEILKYNVKNVIYIESDPALIQIEYSQKDSIPDNLTIVNDDAFRYIRNMKENVDAILLLVPPPSTILLNRFYTTEFFREIKDHLNPGGIFMCSPGPGDNYLNKESLYNYSSIFNSLSGVFKNILPISGNKLYFIGSDNELSSEICRLINNKKIKNIYVGSDYLSDDLIGQKSREISALMDRKVKQNTATFPVASYHFQAYNFSKNMNEKTAVIALMLLLFALPLAAVKRKNIIMYFSAAALAGFEIIALLTLQLIIGNMYQLTGLIIGGLMAGLATGAIFDIRIINNISGSKKCILLGIFYAIIGLSYRFILYIENAIPVVIMLIILVFIPAVITGNIFRTLTTGSSVETDTSSTYSADLSGSALGFILISGFTVPLLGIEVSMFLLSFMIFAGILFGTVRNK